GDFLAIRRFLTSPGLPEDHYMQAPVKDALVTLADLVQTQWPNVLVRVTEAYDAEGEHSTDGPGGSFHYDGRAVDLTTSDLDSTKLSRLAYLAHCAGFAWALNETNHVHAS